MMMFDSKIFKFWKRTGIIGDDLTKNVNVVVVMVKMTWKMIFHV